MVEVGGPRRSSEKALLEGTAGENKNEGKRDEWPSRSAFLFNAVGTTVGISSMWRFPALLYNYGGSFLLVYLLALFCIGYPLLLLEIGMGQYLQSGDIGVFGSINTRARGVGITSTLGTFLFIVYYIPLLSWIIRGYANTFCQGDNQEELEYFFIEIIGMKTLGDNLEPTRIVWRNVLYLMSFWCFIGVMITSGMKYVGRLAYLTMGLLVFNIIIFIKHAIALGGAMESIQELVGQWDLSDLIENPEVWSVAVVEIFFTLGCTFGVMTSMASHCPKNSPASENASIIAFSNVFFNLTAAFGMFSCINYLKDFDNEDVYIEEITEALMAGPAFLFSSGMPPITGGTYWFQLSFLNFFLLGIDNAFAFVGSIRDAISDSNIGQDIPTPLAIWGTIVICALGGMIYMTDAGLIFLDSIDFYINFVMLLIGTCKAFSVGWFYGIQQQITKYGSEVVCKYHDTVIFDSYDFLNFIAQHIFRRPVHHSFVRSFADCLLNLVLDRGRHKSNGDFYVPVFVHIWNMFGGNKGQREKY